MTDEKLAAKLTALIRDIEVWDKDGAYLQKNADARDLLEQTVKVLRADRR